MKCPTKEDLLLHLVNDFEEPPAKDNIPEHLAACPDCHDRARAWERVLDTMQQESGRQCDVAIAGLLDDFKNKTAPAEEDNELQEHLQECRACHNVHLNLNRKLDYDNVMALDLPIPDSLRQGIEKIMTSHLAPSPVVGIIDSLVHQVDDLVDRITLILQPQPVLAFLGSGVSGTAPIATTSTRDLEVAVGAAGRTVKIFSEDNVELGRQVSGSEGVVVFKEFVPATYKLHVEGFEIKDVSLWP